MSVELIGANPGLTLFDAAGERVAFASVWRVDWSVRGAGHALVLWQAGRARLVTDQPELGRWLAEAFVRHFPELDGLPWPTPEPERAAVSWQLDLAVGFRATAADVTVEIQGPLARRLVAVDRFGLGECTRGFSTVYLPCRTGRLTVAGRAVPGAVRVDGARPSSSAFLAAAEVWTAPTPTIAPRPDGRPSST